MEEFLGRRKLNLQKEGKYDCISISEGDTQNLCTRTGDLGGECEIVHLICRGRQQHFWTKIYENSPPPGINIEWSLNHHCRISIILWDCHAYFEKCHLKTNKMKTKQEKYLDVSKTQDLKRYESSKSINCHVISNRSNTPYSFIKNMVV